MNKLICLLALGLSVPVAAEQWMVSIPASDIGAACLDKDNLVSTEICFAFALGVTQTYESLARREITPMPFCLPDEITRKQALSAIRKQFRRARAEASIPADEFVREALVAAFPCVDGDADTTP